MHCGNFREKFNSLLAFSTTFHDLYHAMCHHNTTSDMFAKRHFDWYPK